MAQITVKYKCGDTVRINHNAPTQGIVTAIFIRGRGRSYEISYSNENGPTNAVCEEVELCPCKESSFGFGK